MKRWLIAGLLACGLVGALPAMAQVVHERVVIHHPVRHPVVHRRVIVHHPVRHHYRHHPRHTVVVVHH